MNTLEIKLDTVPTLTLCRDEDIWRWDFEENFQVIQWEGYRDDCILALVEHGNLPPIEDLQECYDWESCDWREARQSVVSYLIEVGGMNVLSVKDAIRATIEDGYYSPREGWIEVLKELIREDFTIQDFCREDDGLASLTNCLEDIAIVQTVTGCSQGDLAHVLIHGREFEKLAGKPWQGTRDRNSLENLIFNQPLYVELELRCDVEPVQFELKDQYDYDRDEIVELCRNHGASEQEIELIEESLPDYA